MWISVKEEWIKIFFSLSYWQFHTKRTLIYNKKVQSRKEMRRTTYAGAWLCSWHYRCPREEATYRSFVSYYIDDLQGLSGKESPANVGHLGLIPGSRRFTVEEMTTHFSILFLEDPTDRGAWWATVHGVAKSRRWLSTHEMQHWFSCSLKF